MVDRRRGLILDWIEKNEITLKTNYWAISPPKTTFPTPAISFLALARLVSSNSRTIPPTMTFLRRESALEKTSHTRQRHMMDLKATDQSSIPVSNFALSTKGKRL